MIQHANQITTMEHRLSNLKIRVTYVEELRSEVIKVNDDLRRSQEIFITIYTKILMEGGHKKILP